MRVPLSLLAIFASLASFALNVDSQGITKTLMAGVEPLSSTDSMGFGVAASSFINTIGGSAYDSCAAVVMQGASTTSSPKGFTSLAGSASLLKIYFHTLNINSVNQCKLDALLSRETFVNGNTGLSQVGSLIEHPFFMVALTLVDIPSTPYSLSVPLTSFGWVLKSTETYMIRVRVSGCDGINLGPAALSPAALWNIGLKTSNSYAAVAYAYTDTTSAGSCGSVSIDSNNFVEQFPYGGYAPLISLFMDDISTSATSSSA